MSEKRVENYENREGDKIIVDKTEIFPHKIKKRKNQKEKETELKKAKRIFMLIFRQASRLLT